MNDSAGNSNLPPDKGQEPDLTQENAPPTLELEESTNALIREIVVAQRHVGGLGTTYGPGTDTPGKVRHPRRLFGARPDTMGYSRRIRQKLIAGLTSASTYRPTRKHLMLAAVAVIMVLRPWLIPVTLFVTFFAVLISYFTLGPDRVAELVVGGWQRLHRFRPELAEKIRQRAEAAALRVDAFLDDMPGTWSEQIHVPDFKPPQDIGADLPDPFERLTSEAQRG